MAGVVRLGQVGREILGRQPTNVLIELHPSFAQTGKGHGTDRGLVAGLLGLATDEPLLRAKLRVAELAGLKFQV